MSAIDNITISAPTRGNRKLEKLLTAVNADPQIKAWWHAAGVNAERLDMSDHSWVHIQIVTNIALRLARLLFRRGIEPSVVKDHGMTERDAEVVIAAGALLHCLGMAIHRTDHERFSLFLAADKLPAPLAGAYDEPERTLIAAESMHAIISHRTKGKPFTVEGAIVRVADALDMAQGRARVPFEAGQRTSTRCPRTRSRTSRSPRGAKRPCASRSRCRTRPGIFQVDEGLGSKLRGTLLEQHIEVIARIDAEHENRLVPVFRL